MWYCVDWWNALWLESDSALRWLWLASSDCSRWLLSSQNGHLGRLSWDDPLQLTGRWNPVNFFEGYVWNQPVFCSCYTSACQENMAAILQVLGAWNIYILIFWLAELPRWLVLIGWIAQVIGSDWLNCPGDWFWLAELPWLLILIGWIAQMIASNWLNCPGDWLNCPGDCFWLAELPWLLILIGWIAQVIASDWLNCPGDCFWLAELPWLLILIGWIAEVVGLFLNCNILSTAEVTSGRWLVA